MTGIANPAFLTSAGALQGLHSEGECYDGPNLVRCPDVLLAKLNPEGTELIYSTFLGGSGFDYGYGVAVDFQGNAFLTGTTNSSDFPVSSDAWQSALSSEQCPADLAGQFCTSAFVTKVNATGTALLYSTYLGGNEGGLGGNGVAVDAHGSAYVTGDGADGGFVAKLHSEGTSLIYSVQGVGGTGVSLDSHNNAYLSGRNGNESYVTKLDSEGAEILYSFRLGGTSVPFDASPQELEAITGIAVDAQGYAYVTGYTAYQDFPTTAGAFSETAPGAGICGSFPVPGCLRLQAEPGGDRAGLFHLPWRQLHRLRQWRGCGPAGECLRDGCNSFLRLPGGPGPGIFRRTGFRKQIGSPRGGACLLGQSGKWR